MDEVDLKVKKLLGINPYPNKCPWCSNMRQVTKFEINVLDGNVHCSECHKQIKLERVNKLGFTLRAGDKTYKMVSLRRKK